MRSGDWGNLFILANSGLFLASVILQNAGVVDWHSASFVDLPRKIFESASGGKDTSKHNETRHAAI